ncbi:MAG: DUF5103 domain-containing protein [bacterium]
MKIKGILFFGFSFCTGALFAWDFPNENRIYDPNIHTVILHKEGFEMAAPIILLNSDEQLRLTFDDLDVSLKSYKYTIRHCSADWTTSAQLSVTDFIDGVEEESIRDFAYSYNTTVEYIHYTGYFPTTYMKPKLSGNYLLIAYLDTPQEPVFTKRFMVLEPAGMTISADIVQSNDPFFSETKQQLDFKVNVGGFLASNPNREIQVIITQNYRWDNALRNLKPKFIRGKELDFTFDPANAFDGGNEFRSVDIKSLRYQTEHIRSIEWDSAYQVYMLDDLSRARKNYTYNQDLNGRFLIKNEEVSGNDEIEADYAWVHFSLPSTMLIPGGKFYILGGLTDWQMHPGNEMVYDPASRRYTCSLYLKQGYYDYLYVFKPDNSPSGEESFFEGSHWETENQYSIYVYLHPLSGLYDQLVAVQDINTGSRK